MRQCAVHKCNNPVVDPDQKDMGSCLCYWHYLQGCENDDHKRRLIQTENKRFKYPQAVTGVSFY